MPPALSSREPVNISTLNQLFYSVIDRDPPAVMLTRGEQGWTPISAPELYRKAVGVAKALTAWDIRRGDRIAILSENRPEWAIADFAAMLSAVVVVPLYPTLTAEQMAGMLRDSGARVIFVSTRDQWHKVNAIRSSTGLERIVLMDSSGKPDTPHAPDTISMRQLMEQGPAARDAGFDARAQAVGADELATIIYTSGTTGTPKGVMLTQGNLASNLSCSLELYKFTPGQVSISFLPLSHITARHLDYAMFWNGVTVAYCPHLEDLLKALLEVRPHVFVGVPRVYEKICRQVQTQVGGGLKRRIYHWAMSVGRAQKDQVLAGEVPAGIGWKIADRLLYSRVKKALGGRAEIFISGGAPLNRDLIDWYASIGIRIFEGYGLTETSPVIALNNPQAYRAGSVGKPLRNIQVTIAGDGEILVKGPSIFKGYWNKPEDTRQAFDGEWFRTGDIGRRDTDGFLYITDRKKDLIKTSGGKFITPQPIEAKLKANLLVAEAAVIGDKRNFPSVILVPNFAALEDWARQQGLEFVDRRELVAHSPVRALYAGVVEQVNQELAQFEKLKKFLLISDEPSIAAGNLTPTMKLRRRILEDQYRTQIDEIYGGGSTAP